MKKLFHTLFLAFFTMSLFAREKVNIVFIGNSITYGAEINHETEAPPVRVGQMLAERGYEADFRNCGVSGSTTVDWLPERDSWIFQRMVKAADELAKKEGTLIFSMMLGTNDSALENCTGAPLAPADYYNNVKTIVDYILARYKGAKVIVNYPLWYSPHTYNSTRYLHQGLDRLKTYLPQLDKLCKAYRKTHKGQVFSGNRHTFSYFEGREDLFVPEPSSLGQGLKFYLHPNPKGAIRLARFWTKSILKAL